MSLLRHFSHHERGDHFTWHWPVGAAVLAAALAVAVVDQRDELLSPGSDALWAGVAAVPWLLDVALIPKRRHVPVLVFVLVVVASVDILLETPVEADFAPFFLVLLASEMASRLRPAGAIAVIVFAMGTMLSEEIWGNYDDSFVWLLGIALGGAAGMAVQIEFRLIDEMRRSQQGLAERAAAEERQRIAREIHDVIAHSLAVTMLHLTGARLALRRDPEEAEEALLEAERLGRESLAEIRRTVGLLAPEGTGTAAPMPTAADIPELVREFEAAGLDVELELSGDPGTLAPATGLGLYRVAQESLSNVVRHAPGSPTSISLRIDDDTVCLHVRNRLANVVDVPSADGGTGVRGMQERVTLLGGVLQAGPDETGWRVDVELPRALETA